MFGEEIDDAQRRAASREASFGEKVEEAPAHLSAEPICPGWSETTAVDGGHGAVALGFARFGRQRERERERGGKEGKREELALRPPYPPKGLGREEGEAGRGGSIGERPGSLQSTGGRRPGGTRDEAPGLFLFFYFGPFLFLINAFLLFLFSK